MNGFERRKEHNKQKILNATESLLKKHYFKEVTIEDIAREAGVSKVTIYHHFSSKDNLIYYYVQIFASKVQERFRELLKTDKSYMEKLEAIFEFATEVNESSPGFNTDEIRNDPKLQQLVDSVLSQQREVVFEYIKEGKKQGYLNPDLSDEAIRSYIEIVSQGMRANPEVHHKMRHDPKLFHDLLLMLLYGFCKIR